VFFFNLILVIVFLTLLFVVLTSVYYSMKGRNTVMTSPVPAATIHSTTRNSIAQSRTQVSYEELDSRILDYNFDNLRAFEKPAEPIVRSYAPAEIFTRTITEKTASQRLKMDAQFR
jgi:CBS-domain-containing membrane protein